MLYLTDLSHVPASEEVEAIKQASLRVKEQIQLDFDQNIVYEQSRPTLTHHDFNITHHFPIVLALVDKHRVGIDVTYGGASPQFDEMELLQLFTTLPRSEREFSLMWAIREAHLKYTGEGFRETPVHISKFPDADELPDIEALHFTPPVAEIEGATIHCFTVRGLVGAAECSLHALSKIQILA